MAPVLMPLLRLFASRAAPLSPPPAAVPWWMSPLAAACGACGARQIRPRPAPPRAGSRRARGQWRGRGRHLGLPLGRWWPLSQRLATGPAVVAGTLGGWAAGREADGSRSRCSRYRTRTSIRRLSNPHPGRLCRRRCRRCRGRSSAGAKLGAAAAGMAGEPAAR
jgi:hypothetical protein